MKKTKKIVTIILSVALLLGVFVTLAVFTSAESPTPNLDIAYCNLSFRDSICIKYAVKSNVSNVKMLIWTSPESEYTIGTHDSEITEYYTENINGVSHMIFDYTELSAKQMTDVIYARAYVQVDGADYYSNVNKYSILQYAYNMLGKTASSEADDELKELLTQMLAYGAAAQKYFDDYKIDRLATSNWYQVVVTSGCLDDGCAHGLYLPGDKVTMIASTIDENGATFCYWADSRGNKIGTTAIYELTVGNKNEIYTPVYIKYSTGLEFDSNGDGTCYIISMGDCTDTELVIPPVSPENDTVVGIDSAAFAGEAITSVSFPSTLKEIGRRAFNNCTTLTDVYYDGTEMEWNEISISTGNDAIENATKHFNEPAVETFTVTFVDYDGTVLKTEIVESGKRAIPPTDPVRESYTFTGWDQAFDNVTTNLTVTAQYEYSSSEPTIIVSNATASVGESVTVTVNIASNPGVAGAKFKVEYDSKLMLTAAESGAAFSVLDYTAPATLASGCPFNWDSLDAESTVNGTILTLTFTVSESASIGEKLNISVSYVDGDVYNTDLEDLSFVLMDGIITVE